MKLFLCLITFLVCIQLQSLEVPSHKGPIIDLAGVLSPQDQYALSASLTQFKNQYGPTIQLLVIPSLEDDSLEGFSIRTVEKWQLGSKNKDDGLLFLISIEDKKMRIEVGRGLEGELPDITAGRIIKSVKPYFKKSDYKNGIVLGLSLIAKTLGGELKGAPRVVKRKNKSNTVGSIVFLLFVILMLFDRGGGSGGKRDFLTTLLLIAGMNAGRSSGGFSSGGGSFGGGGGFSGGGASGGW